MTSTKFVAVLNKKIEVGKIMNALADKFMIENAITPQQDIDD